MLRLRDAFVNQAKDMNGGDHINIRNTNNDSIDQELNETNNMSMLSKSFENMLSSMAETDFIDSNKEENDDDEWYNEKEDIAESASNVTQEEQVCIFGHNPFIVTRYQKLHIFIPLWSSLDKFCK